LNVFADLRLDVANTAFLELLARPTRATGVSLQPLAVVGKTGRNPLPDACRPHHSGLDFFLKIVGKYFARFFKFVQF